MSIFGLEIDYPSNIPYARSKAYLTVSLSGRARIKFIVIVNKLHLGINLIVFNFKDNSLVHK